MKSKFPPDKNGTGGGSRGGGTGQAALFLEKREQFIVAAVAVIRMGLAVGLRPSLMWRRTERMAERKTTPTFASRRRPAYDVWFANYFAELALSPPSVSRSVSLCFKWVRRPGSVLSANAFKSAFFVLAANASNMATHFVWLATVAAT